MNLEVLDLTGNELVNDSLMDIMMITSLKALVIRYCGLNASKLLEGTSLKITYVYHYW